MSQISTQTIHFVEKLLKTLTQIRHTGWGKKPKKNKRTGTYIRDPRVYRLRFNGGTYLSYFLYPTLRCQINE